MREDSERAGGLDVGKVIKESRQEETLVEVPHLPLF